MRAVTISSQTIAGVELLTIAGRLDNANSVKLKRELDDLLNRDRHRIGLELSGVNFISSKGVEVLLLAQRNCLLGGGDLVLLAPSKRVVEVLTMAGVDVLFQRFQSLDDALNSFHS